MKGYLTFKQNKNMSFIFRYETPEVALNCGVMVRECIRHELLAKEIINAELFYRFFHFVELSTFDIASDAFTTFKVKMAIC